VEEPRVPGEADSDPGSGLGAEGFGRPAGGFQVNRLLGGSGIEEALWREALARLSQKGIRPALELLLGASCSAQSVRERSNYRILMAKVCLRAGRADLARPIVEELNTLVTTLHLDQWESPIWMAEALGTLFQCLTADGAKEGDRDRAREILTRLCTLDITRAMEYARQAGGK
jgi:type VI secretion system protein ImpA